MTSPIITSTKNNPQERDSSFLDPERMAKLFELKKGDYVADFGAGHGYFTIPIARVVGGDGKVYAIDIQKSVLDIIRAKARVEHLLNIEPVWADLDEPKGSKLKDTFVDFVLIANILFQADRKEIMLLEAYRVLREGGRLAIVEWEHPAENIDILKYRVIGPPAELRVDKRIARGLAIEAGFTFEKEFTTGSHHYGLLFVKK